MNSPEWIALGALVLMAGLLLEGIVFRALHDDLPSTYELFAVRDELMRPVVGELRDALLHLVGNHHGVFVQIDSRRREVVKIQKEHARALLNMMPAGA